MLEYQQKYVDDAGELIAKLESELINFEHDQDKETAIQELFRVMHTLKGTSSMFGFERISQFTHLLEDIYDLIRKNELAINTEIIDLTFQSVDQLKLLLNTREQLTADQEDHFAKLMTLAMAYSSKELGELMEFRPEPHGNKPLVLHRIQFTPSENVLLRGIDPLAAINEISNLGECVKFHFTDESIECSDEDDESFNQFWELYLCGSVETEAITDIFMFYNDDEYKIEPFDELSKIETFIASSLSVKNGIAPHEIKEKLEHFCSRSREKLKTQMNASDGTETRAESSFAEETIRVSSAKLDNLLNAVSELVILHSQLDNHALRLKDDPLNKTIYELSKLSRYFRDEILSTRLISVDVMATSMHRLVRDLSHKLGKKIELITDGLHTELDKNIINKIEAPLMHIIRNCIDHGIESQEERLTNDKEATGKIRFIASCTGGSVFIQIQDDGRGIDTQAVWNKAITKGISSPNAVLTDKEIYELMFYPGLSTSSEISEISGRGVGLDIVKKVVRELHGEINVDSEKGLGTSFTIKLPLTLSILDALHVNCREYKILIPTSNILFCKFIPKDYFKTQELSYPVNNRCVPVKRLSDLFDYPPQHQDFEILIVFSIYDVYFGLLVDRIITSLQAVVKPLGHLHHNQPYFIGTSVLGDGSMAYILDTNLFLKLH